MLTPTAFYFLRHGETDWNREDRAQGRIDIPLNATGLVQARDAAACVVGLPIVTICTSPLSRARVTAEIVGDRIGLEPIVLDELVECNWGDREGSVKGPWYEDWKDGRATPPGSEACENFHQRAIDGINRALERPGPVLVVCHGGIFGAIRRFGGLNPSYSIPNALPVRLDPPIETGGGWSLAVIAERTAAID